MQHVKAILGTIILHLSAWGAQVTWAQISPGLIWSLAAVASVVWLAIHYRSRVREIWARSYPLKLALVAVAIAILGGPIVYFVFVHDSTVAAHAEPPIFIKSSTSIYPIKSADGKRVLASVLDIVVQNKGGTARGVERRVLMLEKTLNPTVEPLLNESRQNPNEFAQHQSLTIRTQLSVSRKLLSSFVVLDLRYEDESTSQSYSREWFMKFSGVTRDGDVATSLFDATADERRRIESYMKDRNIQRSENETDT